MLNILSKHAAFIALLLTGLFLIFFRLDHYFFWTDEGETALYARNIIRFYLPYGFDGRNLHEIIDGGFLNEKLINGYIPWMQFYLTAISFTLFGSTNWAARAPFALFGLLTLITQYIFICRFFQSRRLALINTLFLITNASFLLFSRQCRYYSLISFGILLIMLFYLRFENRKRDILLIAIMFLALYFSHNFMAFSMLAGLAISLYLFDDCQKSLKYFMYPLFIMAPIVSLYMLWMNSLGQPKFQGFLSNLPPSRFLVIFYHHIRDYNNLQLTPYVFWILLIIYIFKNKHTFINIHPANTSREHHEIVIMSVIIITTLFLSILSLEPISLGVSNIRYAVGLFPFLILIQSCVIDRIISWKRWVGYPVLMLACFTNVFTFNAPKSYFLMYLNEIFHPHDNAIKSAVKFLETRIRQDERILVSPNYNNGPLMFYLGDQLLFCNVISENNKNILKKGIKVPDYIYKYDSQPDWIVMFTLQPDEPFLQEPLRRLNINDYIDHSLPILGMDVSRPELFWRSFSPITSGFPPQYGLHIFERKDRLTRPRLSSPSSNQNFR